MVLSYFLQISLISGLIEDNWTLLPASAFQSIVICFFKFKSGFLCELGVPVKGSPGFQTIL